jgi:hypothetical protein
MVMLRALAVPMVALAMVDAPVAGADPPATEVITAVPVGPDGAPINGYQVTPPAGNLPDVTDCSMPSPSAVVADVYYCTPSTADADTCWPSATESLLCVDDPWDQHLHRVNYGSPLPYVQPTATPDPFAVVLDDGTRCRLRNGGGWGGRDDGYVGMYGCGAANSNLAILWLPSQGIGSWIDRSTPQWTVKVGQLGSPGTHFPPPDTRAVTTAWFAGSG